MNRQSKILLNKFFRKIHRAVLTGVSFVQERVNNLIGTHGRIKFITPGWLMFAFITPFLSFITEGFIGLYGSPNVYYIHVSTRDQLTLSLA